MTHKDPTRESPERWLTLQVRKPVLVARFKDPAHWGEWWWCFEYTDPTRFPAQWWGPYASKDDLLQYLHFVPERGAP